MAAAGEGVGRASAGWDDLLRDVDVQAEVCGSAQVVAEGAAGGLVSKEARKERTGIVCGSAVAARSYWARDISLSVQTRQQAVL